MFKMNLRLMLAVTFALPLLVPAGVRADIVDDVYRKASKEGKLIWYTTGRKSFNRKFSKFWKKRFPKVKISILRKNSGKIISTFEAERAAGRVRPDVLAMSVPYQAAVWKSEGIYSPYKVANWSKIPKMFKDADGHWTARSTFVLLGAYNTNKIKKKSDLPLSLKDMTDPKWKGRLLSTDPVTAGSGRTFYAGIIQGKLVDWSFLEALAKQKMMFVRGNSAAARMIVAGERDVAVSISSHNIVVAMKKKQPISFYIHKEGAVLNMSPMGLVKGAKHPWAAKLLLEWQFSDEGQNAISRWAGQWSVMGHIPPPEGMPDMSSMNVVVPDLTFMIKEGKSFLARFSKIMGRE